MLRDFCNVGAHLHAIKKQSQYVHATNRPSDRVCRCGTAQFGQTRTISTIRKNSQHPCTIRNCLLEILIKTGISGVQVWLIHWYRDFQNIFRLFSDYLPSKTTRPLCYPNNKAFLPQPALSWALVYYLDIHYKKRYDL